MTLLAIAALLGSAVSTYFIGAAFVAPRGSFLRTKTGIGLLVAIGISFVLLPPQLPTMDAMLTTLGSGQPVLPGLEWPANFSSGLYIALWLGTSLVGLLVGLRIWQAGQPGYREGSSLSDASGASRVSSLLPLADTLPKVLDVLAQARLTERDAPRVAGDVREAGRKLADALPPSDGALYTMVAAKMPPAVAAWVTGYLLEGAGRRGGR